MADPFPNGDSGGGGDQFCPLDSPVDDVWLHVLSYLDDDPRDLMNLADTCVYFQELVETPRPLGYGAAYEACRLEEVLPFIFKWLGKRTLLNTRLVCHRLRSTMDKILENGARITTHRNLDLFPRLLPLHPLASERQCSFDWYHFRYENSSCPSVVLKTVEQIANYQEFLEGHRLQMRQRRHRGHRIVAKTISVKEPYIGFGLKPPAARLEGNTALLQRALEFFRAFTDKKIQSVNLQVVQNTPVLRVYKFLLNFCGALPHFKCLDISPIALLEIPLIPHTVEEEYELDRYARDHRLPIAPNLERISIMYPVPLPFIREVAGGYGLQLRILILDISEKAFSLQENNPLPEYQFPVLEEMKLRMKDKCIRFIKTIKAPSLKTLRLIPVKSYDEGRWTGNSLVDLVNAVYNFPSITTLQLDICLPLWKPHITRPWMKRHRGLRNLAIITAQPIPPLRFFTKWFPNVEWISVKVSAYVNVRKDKDLKLLWGGRFQESSIWRETPTLETVRMRFWYDRQRHIWWRKHGGET